MKSTTQAVRKREMLGRQTELEFEDYLQRNQGSTAYEIAKGLNWSYGRVQGVLKRMEGRVRYEDTTEKGRAKKKVYLIMAGEFLEPSAEEELKELIKKNKKK